MVLVWMKMVGCMVLYTVKVRHVWKIEGSGVMERHGRFISCKSIEELLGASS